MLWLRLDGDPHRNVIEPIHKIGQNAHGLTDHFNMVETFHDFFPQNS